MPATSIIGGLVGVTSTNFRVCSCEDGEDLKCEGTDYHTWHALTCPFHSLAYEIECHERAEMAEQLVHPILKRGHSNWLKDAFKRPYYLKNNNHVCSLKQNDHSNL